MSADACRPDRLGTSGIAMPRTYLAQDRLGLIKDTGPHQ